MPPTSKRWNISPRAPEAYFARFPDLPPLIVQVLHNRQIDDPDQVRQFLARRPYGTTDPFQLKGMSEAVARLRRALRSGELIAIYGDYDVDGVTATALMMQTLAVLGGEVRHYIPYRFDEGYGLNIDALTRLAQEGVRVVLTVDCGIRSVKEVVHGNHLRLDMILTDHHHPEGEIPPALAVVNPKQPDCSYPFEQLAGVGLAFKLAQALIQTEYPKMEGSPPLAEDNLLDLVALGTVADLAPLTGENRALVARGLKRLNAPHRVGVQMLMAQAGVQPGRVRADTIGFVLGPRLNAAGRLESALAAYELLVTQDIFRAGQLARQLEDQNRKRARQEILEDGGSRPLYLITRPAFNLGIVGLVSSQLTEEFYRPTLVARPHKTFTRGSARSIPGFHITHALDECADLLERHGGHSAAAGFTVKNENVPALRAKLLAIAERELAGVELIPELKIDARLNLRGINRRRVEDLLTARAAGRPVDNEQGGHGLQIMDGLEQLHPLGEGNEAPVFVSYGLEVKGKRLIGTNGDHLKLLLHDGKQTWDAIAFRQGDWHDYLSTHVDVVYALEINEWNGRQRLQLKVKDIMPTEPVED
ncbi:MAG: single-stranded-DNA-specific exonuclease RecJ [Anaerolineae bacterium]